MLGNKLEQDYYWYSDEYMYFSFNGHHSSKYHLFIQNTKELTIENSVGAASEYSNAMMQEGTYYLGTSRKQKTFKRKCAAKIEDMHDYKRMMKWLTVGTTGELVFDNDRYWGWTVILDTVGDATFVKRGQHIVVEFDITFKTIGTYLAHAVYPATWDTTNNNAYDDVVGTNEHYIPPVVSYPNYNNPGAIFIVNNISNVSQSIIMNINPNISDINSSGTPLELEIKSDDQEYLIANFTYYTKQLDQTYVYNSEYAILSINGQIADESIYCVNLSQPNGMLKLPSEEPVQLKIKNITTNLSQEELRYKQIIITLDDDSYTDLCSRLDSKVEGSYPQYYIYLVNKTSNSLQYSVSPYGQTTKNSCIQSYIAYPENLIATEIAPDYIWNYSLKDNCIIFNQFTSDEEPILPSIQDINEFTLYIGKYYKIDVILTSNQQVEPTFLTTINSYNNL